MAKLNDVSVALCTYNGAKYIEEQLNSIAQQTYLPGEVIICDDCSTDGTVDIIKQFVLNTPFAVKVYVNKPRLGVIKNFNRAIGLTRGKYIALSDQDDVWKNKKLEVSLQEMQQTEKRVGEKTPILIHTDLEVVDEELKVISPSFFKMLNIRHREEQQLKTLLVQNFVTGCTTVINRALVSRAHPIPENVVMHDWWLAQIAAAGGLIRFIPAATMQYRQHSQNVVGAKKFFSKFNLDRLCDIEKQSREVARMFRQNMALLDHFHAGSAPKELISFVKAVKRSGLFTIRESIGSGIYKQGLLRNLAFYYILLRGKYHKYLDIVAAKEGGGN